MCISHPANVIPIPAVSSHITRHKPQSWKSTHSLFSSASPIFYSQEHCSIGIDFTMIPWVCPAYDHLKALQRSFSLPCNLFLRLLFFNPVYLFNQKLLSETLPDAPVVKIALESHLGSLIFPPSPFLPYPVFLLLILYLFIKKKYLQN